MPKMWAFGYFSRHFSPDFIFESAKTLRTKCQNSSESYKILRTKL